IAARLASDSLDDPGGGPGSRRRIVALRDDAQRAIVHGRDYGRRRFSGERDPARDLRRTAAARRTGSEGGGGGRGVEPSAPYSDVDFRDDRRNGPEGGGDGRRG